MSTASIHWDVSREANPVTRPKAGCTVANIQHIGSLSLPLCTSQVLHDSFLRVNRKQKPHDASPQEIEECESQAYDACVRYLAKEESIDIIYAVTAYGTAGRAWKFSRDDVEVYLQPFWGQHTLADRSEYKDLFSTEASNLRQAFQLMQMIPPSKIKGVEYGS